MAIDSLINKLQYVQLEPPDKFSPCISIQIREIQSSRGRMEDCPKVRIQPIKRVFGC